MKRFDFFQMQGGIIISGLSLKKCPLFFCFLCFLITVSPAANCLGSEKQKAADLVTDNQPIDLSTPKYKAFFKELEDLHDYTGAELAQLFDGVKIKRRVLQLMDKQWEAKPYYEYWPLFITTDVIRSGKRYLEKYKKLLNRVEAEFGVDRAYIVAIWGIESRFGTNQGGFNMFQTLNSLFDAYPRRADFFRKELLHFLILCKKNNIDPLSVEGSYAGAFGQAQFMPSSYNAYAVDFDGDNRKDLLNSMPDIFASIANYLKTFGWKLHAPVYAEIGPELQSSELSAAYNKGRKGRVDWHFVAQTQNVALQPSPNDGGLSIVGLSISPKDGGGTRYVAGYPNFQAITDYNHSNKYAMAVAEMAEAFTK